jgi:hypothetical protein
LHLVFLDISRHGIRLELVECVDKGRETQFRLLVLFLGNDDAGLAQVDELVVLLTGVSIRTRGAMLL